MKRNYWTLFFALILLCLGGVCLFFIQKSSEREVSLELLMNDEVDQILQVSSSEFMVLKELRKLESDEVSKSIIAQSNSFIESGFIRENLSGGFTFLYADHKLESVHVVLNEALPENWFKENKFSKVSDGLYSNQIYFLKYHHDKVAFSKSKKVLLSTNKNDLNITANVDAAIGLTDLSRSFSIDFYLEEGCLKQYKSSTNRTYAKGHAKSQVAKLIPHGANSFELRSKECVEREFGSVNWLGEEFAEMKLNNGNVALLSYNGLFHPDELIEEWSLSDTLVNNFLIGEIEMKPFAIDFENEFMNEYKFVGKHEDYIVFADSRQAVKSWYLSIVSSNTIKEKRVSWIPSNYSIFESKKSFDPNFVIDGHFYDKDGRMDQVYVLNDFSCSEIEVKYMVDDSSKVVTGWTYACSKPNYESFNRVANSIVFQDEKNVIRLVSLEGELVWEKQVDEKVIGGIEITDVLGNGKPYLIFNTKDKLYVMDKHGKYQSGFPKALGKKATSQVGILDYDKNHKYRFLIGCADGSVLNVNESGGFVNGWKYISKGVEVNKKIVHFTLENKDYLSIIDSVGNVNLVGRDGVERNFDTVSVNSPYLFKHGVNANTSRFYQLQPTGIKTLNLTGQTDLLPVSLVGVNFISKYQSKLGDYFIVTSNGRLKLINNLGIIELEIPLIDANVDKVDFVEDENGEIEFIVISDDKNLYLYNTNGVLQKGYPIETESIFYLTPSKDETLKTVLTYVNGKLKNDVILK